MKVLHIEDFFHPNAGYQLNVLAKFMARDGHDVSIITSEMEKMPPHLTEFFGDSNIEREDCEFEKKYNIKIFRVPIYANISGRSIYKCGSVWNLIDEINPDVLYVHGSDTYIAIRVFLRMNKFKCTVVSDNHMVDMASANRFRSLFRCAYRAFITPIIQKYKIPIIHDANIDYIFAHFKIPKQLGPSVSIGTDTMLFHPNEKKRNAFRNANGISTEAFLVLYAGKLDENKGGMLLAELTCQELRTNTEIVYVFIGNAIGEYGQSVENLFSKSKYRILRFPTQPYSRLADFYQAADIALIAKQCSLSLYDFAATGLPIVAEDNETNVNRIKSLGAGKTFASGDVNAFAAAVAAYANMPDREFMIEKELIAKNAKEQYGYDKQYKKYISVIKAAIEAQNIQP